ncbi:Alkaline ceramidase 3, partial [Tupaia chinensis]
NTVSNLIMIIPPIFGAIQSVRDGLEKRYTAAYLALTVSFSISFCFFQVLCTEYTVMYGMLVFTLVLRSIYIVTWNFRKKLPPIIGVTTQFHAWWHILTGLSSYLHILFSLYTRTLYLRYRPKVKFLFGIWPVILLEPLRKH